MRLTLVGTGTQTERSRGTTTRPGGKSERKGDFASTYRCALPSFPKRLLRNEKREKELKLPSRDSLPMSTVPKDTKFVKARNNGDKRELVERPVRKQVSVHGGRIRGLHEESGLEANKRKEAEIAVVPGGASPHQIYVGVRLLERNIQRERKKKEHTHLDGELTPNQYKRGPQEK